MNFNSLEFLVFLPVVFILHWLLPHRFRWALLLGASWLFYFWWDFWTGFLLVGAAPVEALGPEVVLATVLFDLQVYCDFSGYSDIARGAARLLGIELTENFREPYGAATVREFWRRWHISLTSWFTDYVYIPLGGNRKGLSRQVLNILIVFLLSGLWHGAGWTFVVWGLIHGLYQTAGVVWAHVRETPPKQNAWAHVCTFLLVSFPWLFFRAPSMGDALTLFSRLFTGWSGLLPVLGQVLPLALPLACLPLAERLSGGQRQRDWYASVLTVFCALTAIGTAWLAHLAGGGENAFIYFQF